jgi:hypothetical protein
MVAMATFTGLVLAASLWLLVWVISTLRRLSLAERRCFCGETRNTVKLKHFGPLCQKHFDEFLYLEGQRERVQRRMLRAFDLTDKNWAGGGE